MRAAWLLLLIPMATAQVPDFGQGLDCDGAAFQDVHNQTLALRACTVNGGFQAAQTFVSIEQHPRVHVEAFGAVGSGAAIAWDMEWLHLVEFLDDGDGAYVPGSDEVLAQHDLRGWHPFETEGLVFHADALDDSVRFGGQANDASLSTRFGLSVTPTHTHAQSQWALVLRIEGNDLQGNTTIQAIADGATATLSGTMHVDGQLQTIQPYVALGDQAAGMTWAFPRGDALELDLTLDLAFHADRQSPGFGVALTLGLLAWLARR